MRFFMIRHGETDWNIAGKWQGHVDIPMNESGLLQAEKIARRLRGKFGNIYSSDLCRAVKTAEIIAYASGKESNEITRVETLREIALGEWEGLTYEEIAALGGLLERFRAGEYASLGGETEHACRDRIARAVREIAEAEAGSEKPFLIVSHGAAIRQFIFYVLGVNGGYIPFYNTSFNEFEYDAETKTFTAVTINDGSHLFV
ncbi:phosphoglycerate mutase [Clostridia bacterium]|nr:phosphoglycerate mutase [Clostridia bacterium]